MKDSDIQISNSNWNFNLTRYLWSKKLRRPEHLTDMVCKKIKIKKHKIIIMGHRPQSVGDDS